VSTIRRQGTYWRVADPQWEDPFDGAWSMRRGGRWNAPGSFPVTYLNADLATARANAERYLGVIGGLAIEVEDFDVSELPVAVPCVVREATPLDVVTDSGCRSVGLPVTYPLDAAGHTVSHAICQPLGRQAYDNGQSGVACRSAAMLPPASGEELAWFDRRGARLVASGEPIPMVPV
jgi:hypothetical protein